jgi:hypothetical protein
VAIWFDRFGCPGKDRSQLPDLYLVNVFAAAAANNEYTEHPRWILNPFLQMLNA